MASTSIPAKVGLPEPMSDPSQLSGAAQYPLPVGMSSTAMNYDYQSSYAISIGHILPSQQVSVFGAYNGNGVAGQTATTTWPSPNCFSAFQNKPPYLNASVDERWKNQGLAMPINNRNALKRSRYDIRTIARDILLAAGQHPELAPLNAHLEVLKAAFPKQINDFTDLSTIRWDLIDPGDPIPQINDVHQDSATDKADPNPEENRANGVQPIVHTTAGCDGNAIIQRSAQEPLLVASSKEALNIQLNPNMPHKVDSEPIVTHTNGLNDERQHDIQPSSSGTKPKPHESVSTQKSAAEPSATGTSSSLPVDSMKPSSAPVDSMVPSSAPVLSKKSASYAEYRLTMVTRGKPLVNKKSGSVSWRQSPNAVRSSSGTAGTKISKRKPPDVRYPEFNCEWKKCGSRLHNLKTLRKHVIKLHPDSNVRATNSAFRCMWGDCVRKYNKGGGEVIKKLHGILFNSIEKLHEHIEEFHITPIAWRLGDGPQGGLSGELGCVQVRIHVNLTPKYRSARLKYV